MSEAELSALAMRATGDGLSKSCAWSAGQGSATGQMNQRK